MSLTLPLTDEVFVACLKCRYKAYLKLSGAAGEMTDYERLQRRLSDEYRAAARDDRVRRVPRGGAVDDPPSPTDAIAGGAALINGALLTDTGQSCRFDDPGAGPPYVPLLFVRRVRVTTDDRLLLGYGASVLARVQGAPPDLGKIVHGPQFSVSKVKLEPLLKEVGPSSSRSTPSAPAGARRGCS
jgi:hypothetical protein